ncbi:alpha/beta fold hydrolase [Mucilaginibacter ginsenosidivorans]|uniref:Alpha/beta hydrolase n=1 Tax=Mucilaginibacter ginsenosidivorans TaxID=398053 RepID=A0A5B8UU80_9SPHI|nr:alpha/beta fold hydrolase [Mucilaginibacter ginsenosidivorans]QEC61996.1 alpha/beta hydrolase [Mucilaginibacter ginsenosidivorans]
MAQVTSKDGTPIAYEKTGSGLPLILVDGAMCSRDFGPMPKLAQYLANNFTVITYDRRGRNESGDTKPYAVEREIEDIDALIGEAGGSAYVYGISSGAALALAAAASELNITKLALYEPPFDVSDEGHHAPADALAQLKALVTQDRRADAVKYFMKDIIGIPPLVVFMMTLFPIWKKLKAVAHTLPYDITILDGFGLPEERARSVKVRTLVSGGDKSQVLLRNSVKKLAGVMPNSELRMLKGQTHNVSEKAIGPVLVEFFNK